MYILLDLGGYTCRQTHNIIVYMALMCPVLLFFVVVDDHNKKKTNPEDYATRRLRFIKSTRCCACWIDGNDMYTLDYTVGSYSLAFLYIEAGGIAMYN